VEFGYTIYKLLSTDIEKQKMREHVLLELNHTTIKNRVTINLDGPNYNICTKKVDYLYYFTINLL